MIFTYNRQFYNLKLEWHDNLEGITNYIYNRKRKLVHRYDVENCIMLSLEKNNENFKGKNITKILGFPTVNGNLPRYSPFLTPNVWP